MTTLFVSLLIALGAGDAEAESKTVALPRALNCGGIGCYDLERSAKPGQSSLRCREAARHKHSIEKIAMKEGPILRTPGDLNWEIRGAIHENGPITALDFSSGDQFETYQFWTLDLQALAKGQVNSIRAVYWRAFEHSEFRVTHHQDVSCSTAAR